MFGRFVWDALVTSYIVKRTNRDSSPSATSPSRRAPSTTDLERLADLRDRGVLTLDEFAQLKARILLQQLTPPSDRAGSDSFDGLVRQLRDAEERRKRIDSQRPS